MKPASVRLALLAAVVALACGRSEAPPAPRTAADGSVQAMWVTRFDFLSADDVRQVIADCASVGIDRVLFQVRGNATAFYDSPFEPWAEQFGFADPGFDPLALAIAEAHARGIELHAWINVVPAWWGPVEPTDREHLWYRQPDWFWFDQHGKRQALSEKFYVSLNPCLAEVRTYLATVIADVAERYAVDGIHLDYLRFPNEPPAIPAGSGIDYPRDRLTLQRFAAETGGTPDRDRELWDEWRTASVTILLEEIRTAVHAVRPALALSAAVGPEPDRALEHFQDAADWLERGLLEAVYPMNYSADAELFLRRLRAWRERVPAAVEFVPGVMLASGDVELRGAQVRAARETAGAVCFFAYSALFDSPNEAIDSQDETARAERAARRAALGPLLRGE